ncbi:MAG: hypothetical protein AAGE61_01455 [Pseudomonadota bacterium]
MYQVALALLALGFVGTVALAESNLGVDVSTYEPVAVKTERATPVASPLSAIVSTFNGFDALSSVTRQNDAPVAETVKSAPLGPR